MSNLVLIGMPGSGKSTLGRRLAKARGLDFIDTDSVIEQAANQSLQELVNRRGLRYFRAFEEHVLCSLDVHNAVISTGGSAVYSDAAMRHLGSSGPRIYISISLATMTHRISNAASRGLIKMPGHSLGRLYAEREPLYRACSDINFANDVPLSAIRLDALMNALNTHQKTP